MNDEDKDIQKLFNERDIKLAQENQLHAIEVSKDKRRHAAQKRKVQRQRNIAFILAGLIAIGVISVKLQKTSGVDIDEKGKKVSINYGFDDPRRMENLSAKIGSLVYEKGTDFIEKFDTTEVSILSQCSFRTQGNEGFGYNLYNAAQKIMSLDKDLQLYATVATLNDMGNYLNQEVDTYGQSNGEELLEQLKKVDPENELFKDINSLEDLYKTYTTDGSTFKDLKEAQDKQADFINILVNNLQEQRGVTK